MVQFYQVFHQLPQTSAAFASDYKQIFKELRDMYVDHPIILVAYSAQTTASFNAARITSEHSEDIHLVNTENVSIGQERIAIERK